MGELRRYLMLWGVAALLGLPLLTSAVSAADTVTCADFRYQEDAQAYYDANPTGLTSGMESDADGIVCAFLPHKLPPQESPSWQSIVASTAVMVVIGGGGWWYHQRRQTPRSAMISTKAGRNEER